MKRRLASAELVGVVDPNKQCAGDRHTFRSDGKAVVIVMPDGQHFDAVVCNCGDIAYDPVRQRAIARADCDVVRDTGARA